MGCKGWVAGLLHGDCLEQRRIGEQELQRMSDVWTEREKRERERERKRCWESNG
jgi:hypothetical protein